MAIFRLSPAMVGRTRFSISPLAEVGAALQLQVRAPAVHRRWLDHAGLASTGPTSELLAALMAGYPTLPDFLYRPGDGPDTTLDLQLHRLEAVGTAELAGDLGRVWDEHAVPASLGRVLADGNRGLRRLTDAIRGFWSEVIEPYWPLIRSVIEADIAYRAGRIATAGIYEMLGELHREARIDGELLYVDKPHRSDAHVVYRCDSLTLVPSVLGYPQLVIEHDGTGLTMVYGARGVGAAWDALRASGPDPAEPHDHLAALLGRTRADILRRLHVAMTTTQLAGELAQSNSTVNDHLVCLRRAGLLAAWRSGRRVYYRRTGIATALLNSDLDLARGQ